VRGVEVKQGLLGILIGFLVSCSSAPYQEEGLAQVQAGMDKDSVLSLAGNPARTFRENSQDHWIYEYIKNDEHFERQIVFQSGLVKSIGPTYQKKAVPVGRPAAEDSNDMKSFEKNLREETETPKGEFKDLD